ncbi:hypothetical protein OTUT144_0178 [Orientia tsutsugamushi str. UT144]|uniref:Uncharacterized protein n=1 Tax=Orientia tsutsugamushi str. UT144 TaxID=1441384 RepID=A0A0F3RNG2_ORITS|nr:hypothetical protein OTUT144_1476 [Orientia tsutsugamushi str. UT144]KJW07737.1 hypothetical protein OTUT144_0178 [Orientia tsutsugamushi str. UT144]
MLSYKETLNKKGITKHEKMYYNSILFNKLLSKLVKVDQNYKCQRSN